MLRQLPVKLACSLCVVSLLVCGCAGYQVGQQALYRPDVQTVHVPIFESNSFRRNLGEQLAEAWRRRLP